MPGKSGDHHVNGGVCLKRCVETTNWPEYWTSRDGETIITPQTNMLMWFDKPPIGLEGWRYYGQTFPRVHVGMWNRLAWAHQHGWHGYLWLRVHYTGFGFCLCSETGVCIWMPQKVEICTLHTMGFNWQVDRWNKEHAPYP